MYTPDPSASYLIAWAGSILLMVYSIYINAKVNNEKLRFFNPLILSQGLFWGYTAFTSIFYFLDQLGYEFLETVRYPNYIEISNIANSQKYILFGHACYLTGYFLFQRKPFKQKYLVNISPESYIKLSIVSTILALVILKTPFAQLSTYLNVFSTICAVKYFGYSLDHRQLVWKGFLYFVGILIIGFLSGMKEGTLFPLIYLGIILYDKYGMGRTSLVFVPLIVAYFYFIPTLNVAVRDATWYGERDALETLTDLNDPDILSADLIRKNNWGFLTLRLSEISMLNKYVESVPKRRPYYKFEIVKYGLSTLVPRFLMPSKQSPDVTAQKRAIENGAFVTNSDDDFTSAKPQTIADAYMSYGYIGIAITFLIIGFLLAYFAYLLEVKLGYEVGVTMMFYTLFAVLSRGGPFENLFNSAFYGFVLIFVTIYVFKRLNLIELND